MYYIKIPLRHLVRPNELNVETERQQECWDMRVERLLHDIKNNVIPSWATDCQDLETVTIEEES